MNTYLKSFVTTLTIITIVFLVATISDINDIFKINIVFFMIVVPAIIIAALFWGVYRKKYAAIIVSLIACLAYFYILVKSAFVGVYPFGIMIYSGFIYIPLIVIGSMFTSFYRNIRIKKGTYI